MPAFQQETTWNQSALESALTILLAKQADNNVGTHYFICTDTYLPCTLQVSAPKRNRGQEFL